MAIAREKLEQMLAGQPPIFRKMIELRAQGLTHDEIADLLDVTRGAVYRFFKKLAERYP